MMALNNPWEERDPQEAEALKCLVDAEACLGRAMTNGSIEVYTKALEFSEKTIECLPQCALAHYIAAVAQLKIKGDKNYAKQKCKLLRSINSEMANTLARKLTSEIEKIRVRS
jgi:hypothetical protein